MTDPTGAEAKAFGQDCTTVAEALKAAPGGGEIWRDPAGDIVGAPLSLARVAVDALAPVRAELARVTAERDQARQAVHTLRSAIVEAQTALENAGQTCSYHDTEFAKLGWAYGLPRCDSCKQPWRVTRALLALKGAWKASAAVQPPAADTPTPAHEAGERITAMLLAKANKLRESACCNGTGHCGIYPCQQESAVIDAWEDAADMASAVDALTEEQP